MKWKLWLRNLSVSAPRVAVRSQLPWAARAAVMAIAAAVGVLGLVMVYNYGRNLGAPDHGNMQSELDQVRQQLRLAVSERERSAAAAVLSENQLKVERAAQEQLTQQIKVLESDNARLKSDLAFFESLLPTPAGSRDVVIRSFRLQPDADDRTLRYRLLVQQNGRPEKDFVGAVGLKVTLQQDGRPATIQLPDNAQSVAGPAPLSFRHYQRVEGTFTVPAGAIVQSVQVSIHSGGQLRAQQTFTM
jgi:uncharacterized protein DUF6776